MATRKFLCAKGGQMPHPRRGKAPKIPRFSQIVKADDAPALPSPLVHENAVPENALPAPPDQQKFNSRVAAYTAAFVGVLVGGLFVGVKSKDFVAAREVYNWMEETNCSNGGSMTTYRPMGNLQSHFLIDDCGIDF
jgi:hypothetical protein